MVEVQWIRVGFCKWCNPASYCTGLSRLWCYSCDATASR